MSKIVVHFLFLGPFLIFPSLAMEDFALTLPPEATPTTVTTVVHNIEGVEDSPLP
ncbi:MAG: hypothetical protein K2W94_02225 [Alphaproteobacteria bacterium]|nr:hypothetical protein [Alphaproteobacteria bacterium]